MLEKKYSNDELDIELTLYIDNKQSIWFKGKDVALILGYSDTKQAIRKHIDNEDKILHLLSPEGAERSLRPPARGVFTDPSTNGPRGKWCTFINESGFYSLVLSSKLEPAKRFKD